MVNEVMVDDIAFAPEVTLTKTLPLLGYGHAAAAILFSHLLLSFFAYDQSAAVLWLIPRVSFCGYSIPHPSEARVNIRVQTTGDPASEVLKDGCQNLSYLCKHVRKTFDDAVAKYKTSKANDSMDDN